MTRALLGVIAINRVVESTISYTFPVQTGGIFYFPWHRHQIEGTDICYCHLRKTLAKRGKRNCQSSEAYLPQRDSNPGTPGCQYNALTHSATAYLMNDEDAFNRLHIMVTRRVPVEREIINVYDLFEI